MIKIRNKRLMSYDGIECNLPTANDFTFFEGGGGKGGGGTRVVYVPQTVTKEVVRQAPQAPTQSTASEGDVSGELDTSSDDNVGGRKKTLGGTRKLAIPVTTSR